MVEQVIHILLLHSKDELPLGLSVTLAPSLNVSSKASSQATDSNCRWVSKGRKIISCYFITTWSNRDWCSARKPPGKKGQMCPEDRGDIYVIRYWCSWRTPQLQHRWKFATSWIVLRCLLPIHNRQPADEKIQPQLRACNRKLSMISCSFSLHWVFLGGHPKVAEFVVRRDADDGAV